MRKGKKKIRHLDASMARRRALSPSIRTVAKRFVRVLKERGLPVTKAVLFGSHARGRAGRSSDIDLCIVSPSFGRDPIEDLQTLIKCAREVDVRLEPFPASVSDYRSSSAPILAEIRKSGLEI